MLNLHLGFWIWLVGHVANSCVGPDIGEVERWNGQNGRNPNQVHL